MSQEEVVSSSPHLFLASLTKFLKNLHSDDFPIPVGMQIAIHANTGSTQFESLTSTTECDMEKLTIIKSPANTADDGKLIASAT